MLALVAFVELVAVGVALRNQVASEPLVVERVRTEYVALAVHQDEAAPSVPALETAGGKTALPDAKAPAAKKGSATVASAPPAEAPILKAPLIADPVVERLVQEAREARVRDDIRAAIVKLEEANQKDPENATVLYQFGELFEAMGVYDKAADHYQKVFALGPRKAGSLQDLAAHKLSHGFESAQKMEGKLTLGRIRHFNDKRVQEGEKIILTVPIMAAPDQDIDDKLVKVDIFFFDKLDGEIHEALAASKREYKWLTKPVNWKDTGEELLQVTYIIPPADDRDEQLLGVRKYFGQVVEMHYKGELLDHQAWPRTLARQRNVPEANPLFIPDEFIPEDLNEANPLLPPLPRR